MVKSVDASEHEPIFQWESLKEISSDELYYQGKPVPGMMCEIELTSGKTVRVWRSDDGQQYFCHGLTFGGKDAPGGAISPYTGQPVETILQEHFQVISQGQSQEGDILVWQGIAPETTPHSAFLTDRIMVPGNNYLDYSTRLQTKNGLSPETNLTLEQLIGIYGESYLVYRRK